MATDTPTPAQQFLSDFEAYIDCRIEIATLQFQRLHENQREAQKGLLEASCVHAKADLMTSLKSIMRDAKRPGV